MEKEQYKIFYMHLKDEGLLIPQIDEESFDEYIFDNFKAVLPQVNVSGQSELLKAFAEWRDNQGYCTCICDKDIEGFLKDFNSH